MRILLHRWWFPALVGLLATIPCNDALAQTRFVVTKTTDSNDGACDVDCSLREAVIAANTAAGTDTISFAPNGGAVQVFTLSLAGVLEDSAVSGDLDILESVRIEGGGRESTVLDGAGIDRVLDLILPAAGAFDVELLDLTIRNGATPDSGFSFQNEGGGINMRGTFSTIAGTLTLTDCRVTGNTTDNSRGGGGGGISVTHAPGRASTLNLVSCTIDSNNSGFGGGGVQSGNAIVNLIGSEVLGNSAALPGGGANGGGGIRAAGNDAAVEASRSTIVANQLGGNSTSGGGGVFLLNGRLKSSNTTIADNVILGGGEGTNIHAIGGRVLTAVAPAAPAGAPPVTHLLAGAYPNPFNPATTIAFSLASAEPVQLSIFDSAGRRVRTLVAGEKAAGEHTAVWDARDDAGQQVASGVYFAVLRAGGGVVGSGKLVLLK